MLSHGNSTAGGSTVGNPQCLCQSAVRHIGSPWIIRI
jgi:hypothetical protein